MVIYHYNQFFELGLDAYTDRLRLMVDFFFILSGFVIATAYARRMETVSDYLIFLRARIARLYPLHLLALLGFLALAGIGAALHLPANHPEILTLSGLPANAFLLQAWGGLNHDSFNVPSWSISAEWAMYLATPFLFELARRLSALKAALLTIVFVALMGQVRAHEGLRVWTQATFDFGALRALPSFFAGIVLALLVERLPRLGWPRWGMAHASFAATLLVMQLNAPDEAIVALFIVPIALGALCEREGGDSLLTSPLAVRLGEASYSLYMLHGLLVPPVLLALRKSAHLGTPLAGFAALALYAALVGLSLASFKYFEAPARQGVITALRPPPRAPARSA